MLKLNEFIKKNIMKQIITHFTDNDLYTFTCQYYILQTYPRAEAKYSFFDRNDRQYPKGFGELLQEQIEGMKDVVITDEEIEFMKRKIYFLPDWYYNFLRGYRFNPSEVNISQDEENGKLTISIEGKWYSTIMWEMPILSSISELMNIVSGNVEKVDRVYEYERAFEKGVNAFTNGILLADMGTRRRFDFQNHYDVIKALKTAETVCQTSNKCGGKFVGTSNVWLAKEFDLTPIGTMSHQIISAEECVSGVFECNFNAMDKWSKCFDGDVGVYLYDNFSDSVFLDNFSKRLAKTFDGLRVDSGNEKEQTEKIIEKYKSLGIDPKTKSIVYSNALTIDKAIELHKWVNGRMKDSYGIGTHLCANVFNIDTQSDFPYSNIVIKLTSFRITESRNWQDAVKLSNDEGKTLGNKEKCKYIQKLIKEMAK